MLAVIDTTHGAAPAQTPHACSTKPDGSRPTECNHPTSRSGDRGKSRTAISNVLRKAKLDGPLYIRLLTGRFQVRILVAEPAELELGCF